MKPGAFTLSPTVALVTIGAVRAIIGGPAERVVDLVESGALKHAFDLGSGGPTRCLRVWVGSLVAYQQRELDRAELPFVIEDCLGVTRTRLRGQEICDRWSISRPHLLHITRVGLLIGKSEDHCLWIKRESLVQFLTTRAIGAHNLPESSVGNRRARQSEARRPAPRQQGDLCMRLQEAIPPTDLETAAGVGRVRSPGLAPAPRNPTPQPIRPCG